MSKEIRIVDGISHMNLLIVLYGTTLLTKEKWAEEVLKSNGCEISEQMTNEEIEDCVRRAWTADGYDGDPEKNGLNVTVE